VTLGLPFRSLVLRARYTPTELREQLAPEIDADTRFSPLDPPGSRPWIGNVTANGMELRRRAPFRSSFLPIVRARFVPAARGAELHVTMSLRASTRLVVGAWLLASAVAIAGAISTGRVVLVAVPAMCVAVLATGALSFGLEAEKAARYLKDRLGAPENPPN
jgi:hypothetical protein